MRKIILGRNIVTSLNLCMKLSYSDNNKLTPTGLAAITKSKWEKLD